MSLVSYGKLATDGSDVMISPGWCLEGKPVILHQSGLSGFPGMGS